MISTQDKASRSLQLLDELDRKERRSRYMRLTYSPCEKFFVGIFLASWLAIWIFLV